MCAKTNIFLVILNSDQHCYDMITTLWLLKFDNIIYAEMADGFWPIFFDFFFLIRLLAVSRSSAILE